MKTTLELSFAEVCLICEMANKYYDQINEKIQKYKMMDDLYDELDVMNDEFLKLWERKKKETTALCEKMGTARKEMLR